MRTAADGRGTGEEGNRETVRRAHFLFACSAAPGLDGPRNNDDTAISLEPRCVKWVKNPSFSRPRNEITRSAYPGGFCRRGDSIATLATKVYTSLCPAYTKRRDATTKIGIMSDSRGVARALPAHPR